MQNKYKKIFYLSLIIPALVVFGRLYFGNFDVSYFICAGDKMVDPKIHPYKIWINKNSDGYDGQLFYHLALNPFTKKNNEYGISNELSYRKQRILYPFLAYLSSFGNPHLVPFTLLFVNLLATFFMFYFIALFLQQKVASPYLMLFFAFFSGFYLALVRDLSEVLEGCFIVGSMYFFYREKIIPFILCATSALLTREVAFLIIFPGIVVYALLLIRKKIDYKPLIVFFPVAVFAIWKLYLYLAHGTPGGGGNFTSIPFQGMFKGLTLIFDGDLHQSLYYRNSYILYGIYCVFFLGWYFWTALALTPKIKFNELSIKLWLNISWLILLVFILFLSDSIYCDDWSFGRVFSSFSILCFIMYLVYGVKFSKLYIIYTMGTGLVVMFRIIVFF